MSECASQTSHTNLFHIDQMRPTWLISNVAAWLQMARTTQKHAALHALCTSWKNACFYSIYYTIDGYIIFWIPLATKCWLTHNLCKPQIDCSSHPTFTILVENIYIAIANIFTNTCYSVYDFYSTYFWAPHIVVNCSYL